MTMKRTRTNVQSKTQNICPIKSKFRKNKSKSKHNTNSIESNLIEAYSDDSAEEEFRGFSPIRVRAKNSKSFLSLKSKFLALIFLNDYSHKFRYLYF